MTVQDDKSDHRRTTKNNGSSCRRSKVKTILWIETRQARGSAKDEFEVFAEGMNRPQVIVTSPGYYSLPFVFSDPVEIYGVGVFCWIPLLRVPSFFPKKRFVTSHRFP